MNWPDFFDEIICVLPDAGAAAKPLGRLNAPPRARSVVQVRTPGDKRIGGALTHRRIVQEAAEAGLRSVLVLDAAVLLTRDAAAILGQACHELAGQRWGLLSLGAWCGTDDLRRVEGCTQLAWAQGHAMPEAYALHNSAMPALLAALPYTIGPMQAWVETRGGGYERALAGVDDKFVVTPGIAAPPMWLPYQPIDRQPRFAA